MYIYHSELLFQNEILTAILYPVDSDKIDVARSRYPTNTQDGKIFQNY